MECVRCHVGTHWEGAVYCHQCGTRLRNRCVEDGCPAEDLDNAYRFCPLCGKESLFASLGLMDPAATLVSDEVAGTEGEPASGELDAEGVPEDALAAEGSGDEADGEAEGGDGAEDIGMVAAGGEPGEEAPAGDADGAADAPLDAEEASLAAPSPDGADADGVGNGYADGLEASSDETMLTSDVPAEAGDEGEALPAN